MKLNDLFEGKEKNEIEFKDEHPEKKLPDLIYTKVERKIRDGAKDYDTEWKSAIDLVDWSLNELNIKKPTATQPRWSQYKDLIKKSVEELSRARGDDADWTLGV
jgi:hypothetical protein